MEIVNLFIIDNDSHQLLKILSDDEFYKLIESYSYNLNSKFYETLTEVRDNNKLNNIHFSIVKEAIKNYLLNNIELNEYNRANNSGA